MSSCAKVPGLQEPLREVEAKLQFGADLRCDAAARGPARQAGVAAACLGIRVLPTSWAVKYSSKTPKLKAANSCV